MLFLGFVVTALIPPITTSTTAFPPHILSGSSFSLCYFSSFSSSFLLMLLSLGIATCTTTAFTVTTSLPSYRSGSESSTGSRLHLSQSPLKVFSALILETLAHTWHRCLYYASHSIVTLQVCLTCQHLATSCAARSQEHLCTVWTLGPVWCG